MPRECGSTTFSSVAAAVTLHHKTCGRAIRRSAEPRQLVKELRFYGLDPRTACSNRLRGARDGGMSAVGQPAIALRRPAPNLRLWQSRLCDAESSLSAVRIGNSGRTGTPRDGRPGCRRYALRGGSHCLRTDGVGGALCLVDRGVKPANQGGRSRLSDNPIIGPRRQSHADQWQAMPKTTASGHTLTTLLLWRGRRYFVVSQRRIKVAFPPSSQRGVAATAVTGP